ncbi:MAG: preprotein translocase subunit SecG [Pontixanthobacter sp.]
MFLFLTVVQALIAAALVVVILMQRSEGGGLGIGGSPNGMMSARGAADFLSRSTKWLAVAFVVLSIVLAAVAVETTGNNEITSTVDRSVPASKDPLGAAGAPAGSAAGPAAVPAAGAPAEDPLADVAN